MVETLQRENDDLKVSLKLNKESLQEMLMEQSI